MFAVYFPSTSQFYCFEYQMAVVFVWPVNVLCNYNLFLLDCYLVFILLQVQTWIKLAYNKHMSILVEGSSIRNI